MGKRKKVVWIAFVIAILLVMALIAIVIYKKVAPSHVQANLNKLFELKAGEEAVLIDDELQDERLSRQMDIPMYRQIWRLLIWTTVFLWTGWKVFWLTRPARE